MFFSHFCLLPNPRKGLENKYYTAVDLPIRGEPDGYILFSRGLYS